MRFTTPCHVERQRGWAVCAVAVALLGATGLTASFFLSHQPSAGARLENVPAPATAFSRAGQALTRQVSAPVASDVRSARSSQPLPMSFERNDGQATPEVKFVARGRGYNLFLTATQSVLTLKRTQEPKRDSPESEAAARLSRALPERHHWQSGKRPGRLAPAVLRMNLPGASPQHLEPAEELPGTVNYFMGGDAEQWRTGIPTFAKVMGRDVYPGIDVVYYGQEGQLEFDFVVQPGAVASAIRLQFEGADQMELDNEGGLVLQIEGKSVRWPKPLVYQNIAGAKRQIDGGYVLRSDREVGFQLGSYDVAVPLIIDPVLVYSTYLGGSGLDAVEAMVVNSAGNVYLTGETDSLNFPTRTPYRSASAGSNDVFVTKLNSNGTALVYSTYLGGSGDDFGMGIAVDASGNAYVTGQTDSNDFPTRSAAQSNLAGNGGFSDAFLFKLGPGGSNLVYSTYFGGPDVEAASAVAVDASGNAYITGYTGSGSQFPKASPFQNNNGGGTDAFVTKFNSSGSVAWASWLGGADEERGTGIAADSAGNVYVCGEVFSLDYSTSTFPVTSALQPLYGGGGSDGFLTKISSSGSITFSTFLGGEFEDSAYALTLDSSNNILLTGQTSSDDFPITANAAQAELGDQGFYGTLDAFVTKISNNGASVLYSTYLGGELDEQGTAIAVDSSGIYLTGQTTSEFFPVTNNADQSTNASGPSDIFVTKFNPSVPGPSALIYSTYLGGDGLDEATGIGVDTNGNFFVSGLTDTANFITTAGAYRTTFAGGFYDAFVARFFSYADLSVSIAASLDPVPVGSNLTYTVQVNNNWHTTFTGVFLTNFLPGSVTFVSMTTNRMTCANSSGTITCNVGTLTNNASASVTIVVRTTTPTNLADTAILVSNQPEMNSGNNNPTLVTTVQGFADLALGQIDIPDPVLLTSNLTYSITITNKGPWPATQVQLTNVFPGSADFISVTQSLAGDFFLLDTNVLFVEFFDPLPVNAKANVTIVVHPNTPGLVTNLVGVSGFEIDLAQGNNLSSIVTTVNSHADLSLTGTVSPASPITSSNVTYNFTINNLGPFTAPSVIFTNKLPANTTFVSSVPGNCTVAGGVVTCGIGNMATGATFAVSIVAKANSEGPIVNIANVRSSLTDAVTNNNTVILSNNVMPLVDLVLTGSDAPDPVTLSSNLVYTLVVTNRGVSIAPSVTLSDTLPPSVSYISAVPTQGSCSITGGVVTCSLGSVLSLSNAVVRITVSPTLLGFITNMANVTTTTTDVNTTNNSVTISTKINSPPTISSIADQSIDEDTSTGPLSFTIGDIETPATNLVFTATSSNPALVSAASINLGGTGANRTVNIVPLPNQFGSATITVNVKDADNGGASTSFVLTVNPVNDPPTLNAISNLPINEDAPLQTVNLAGISSGAANELQTLTVSAFSSDPTIIPNPTVNYTSPNPTGTLSFAPVLNASGVVTMTVTVDDNAGSNNIVTRTFTVTVNPVNDPPTLSTIAPLSINEDSGLQTVGLSGISSGAPNEFQNLTVTATHNNPALLQNLSVSYASPNPSGTLSFGTVTNASGSATITVTVNDNGASNNLITRTFTVTVNPVNDPPTLDAIANLFILEDAGPQTVTFGGITTGAPDENQTLTVTASNGAPAVLQNLAVNYTSPASGGALTFTTVTNAFGTNTITITVNDGGTSNNIVTRTFTVGVASVNDLPTVAAIADQTTSEDTAITIPVTVGDVETPASNLQLTLSSSNPGLVPNANSSGPNVTFGGSGASRTVRILPLTNANGAVLITLNVADSDGGVSSTSFNLNVLPVNDPPVITSVPSQTTLEDTLLGPVSFTVSDVENAPADLVVQGSSSNSGLVPNANIFLSGTDATRTVSILPATNQFGTTTITLSVIDTNGAVTTTSFLLTVTSVNDLPVLSSLTDLTVNEDNPGITSFTVSDVETPAANLTLSAVSSNPGLVPNANVVFGGSGANRTATITPAASSNGTAVISIIVTDTDLGKGTNTFLFTVNPVNDPPTLNALGNLTINEDGGLQTINLSGITAGPPNENQTLTVTASSSDTTILPNPNVNYTSPNSTGTITFIPVTNAFGTATITVNVDDNAGSNNIVSRSFTVTVNPVNDPPVILPIATQSTQEDTSIVVPFMISDVDSPVSQLTVSASSTNTVMVPASGYVFNGTGTNRTVLITPAANQFGTNRITLTASDGALAASTSFMLVIVQVNDPPTINPLPNIVTNVSPGNVTVNLSGITAGAGGEVQTLTVTASSDNTSVVPTPSVTYASPSTTGSLKFRPPNNTSGIARVTVTVNDGAGSNNLTSVSFLVFLGQTNAVPIISSISNQSIIENSSTPAIPFTVRSAVMPADLLVTSGSSSNQTLVPDDNIVFGGSGSNRTVTVTPVFNQFGTSLITVSVTDTNFNTTNTSFLLTVNFLNQLPTISVAPTVFTDEDTPTSIIPVTINDVETSPTNLILTGTSSNTNLVRNTDLFLDGSGSNRNIQVTPASNQFGTAHITLVVTDANGGKATNGFDLTINPVNDPPTLNAISAISINEDAPLQTVSLSGITAGPANEIQNLTVTAASSNPSFIPNPTVTYTSPNTTGSLSFAPVANLFGSASISVTVNDNSGSNNLVSQTFVVTVNPVNDPPTLDPIANVSLNENAGLQTVNLTGITYGPANENQSIILTASSSNPGLIPSPAINYTSPASTGTLTFTPTANSNGMATITVTANDAQPSNNIVTRSFTITVNGAPRISSIPTQTIDEDTTAGPISFTVQSSTMPASNLLVTASSSNTNLVPNQNLVLSGTSTNRTLTMAPAANLFGNATITLTVTDTNGAAASTTFLLAVNSVNDAPTLDPISNITMDEDGPTQTVPLSGIGTGAPNETQTLSVSATSSNPSLIPNPTVTYTSANPTGSLSFTPLPNANGTSSITVTVNDGGTTNGTFSRAFIVTVRPINDPPTLGAIADVTINEDAGFRTVLLTGISAGPANENQVLTLTATNNNPSLLTNVAVNYFSPFTTANLTFGTISNASGTALLTVTVDDGGGSNNFATQTFTVTVLPVNDAPTLNPISDLTINEDAGLQTINLTGISSGAPDEVQTLTVTASALATNLFTDMAINYTSPASTGTLSFSPPPNQFGTNTISVTVNDGGASNNFITRTFTVRVVSVNDPPTIGSIPAQTTDEDTPITINFTVGDVETPAANLTVTGASSNTGLVSTASMSFDGAGPNRTLTILPLTNANGTATVTITATDSDGGTTTTSFNLTVNAVNDPPSLSSLANVTINEDTPSGPISFTVQDVESSAASLVVSASSDNLTLVPVANIVPGGSGANRTINITPAANQFGTALITVTVTDTGNLSASQSFTLTVNPVNDAPTLDPISDLTINEDAGQQTVPLSGITSGAANESQTLTITAVSSQPAVIANPTVLYTSPNSAGSLSFSSAPNANGSATITVTVDDGGAANNLITRTFNVTVLPVNDIPFISNPGGQTVDEDTLAGPIDFTVDDVETPAANLVVSAASSNPVLVSSAGITFGGSGGNRTVSILPETNANGTALITLTVTDGDGASNSVTFNLTVNPVNDPPVIGLAEGTVSRINEDSSSPLIPFTVEDVESPASSLIVTASSADTNLLPSANIVLGGSGTNRTIMLTPAPDQHGNTFVTIQVRDPGGATSSASFVLAVNPVNDPPTLDPITDLTIAPNSGQQTVNLTGISTGPSNESAQTLTITAVSSNPAIIPTPAISYSAPSTTAQLTFTPVPGASGSAMITVTLHDDAGTANGGQDTFSRSFNVTIPSAPALNIVLSGDMVVLSWPTNAVGFQLETRAELGGSETWTVITDMPSTSGDQNVLTRNLDPGTRFYRLRK